MEDWVYHKTYSGTPQGGILSPVLTNIYLNELDKRMETIASEFGTPALHCCSTVYSKARTYIYKLRREYGKTANPTEKKELLKRIHQLEVEKRKLPCKDASDKKIVYVRYAEPRRRRKRKTPTQTISVRGAKNGTKRREDENHA